MIFESDISNEEIDEVMSSRALEPEYQEEDGQENVLRPKYLQDFQGQEKFCDLGLLQGL